MKLPTKKQGEDCFCFLLAVMTLVFVLLALAILFPNIFWWLNFNYTLFWKALTVSVLLFCSVMFVGWLIIIKSKQNR